MGNIRPSFIKIRAIRLCEEYPDQFNDDFDHNKALVAEYTDVENKRMRNWIAGLRDPLHAAPRGLRRYHVDPRGRPIRRNWSCSPPKSPGTCLIS